MSTEALPQETPGGAPDASTNDFKGDAAGGDLFIRDLASSSMPLRHASEADDDDDEEENDEENIVTTMMVGEEGRGGEPPEKEPRVTTLALGEEGDRGMSMRIRTTLAIGEEGDRAGERPYPSAD